MRKKATKSRTTKAKRKTPKKALIPIQLFKISGNVFYSKPAMSGFIAKWPKLNDLLTLAGGNAKALNLKAVAVIKTANGDPFVFVESGKTRFEVRRKV